MWVEAKTFQGHQVLMNLDQVTSITANLPTKFTLANDAGVIVAFNGAEDNCVLVAAKVDDFKYLASRFMNICVLQDAPKGKKLCKSQNS